MAVSHTLQKRERERFPMTPSTASPARNALRAVAISTFGTIVAATMPLAVILSIGDVAGGLSVSADEASWITTLYNVGAIVGVPMTVGFVGMFGRGRPMRIVGLGFARASRRASLIPWNGS